MKQWLDNLAYWWLDIDPADIAFAKKLDVEAIAASAVAYEEGRPMPWLGVYMTDFGALDIVVLEKRDEKTTA